MKYGRKTKTVKFKSEILNKVEERVIESTLEVHNIQVSR